MAFFVVLHHPHDRSPTRWSNEWERGSLTRIRAITTTARIAEEAQAAGRVFVHRCAHGAEPAAVVCEARVVAVTPLESKRGADCLVTFETVRTLNAVPPVSPERGMNSYVARDP